MKIALTPEMEELIRQKVANGRYESPADVVEAAVQLLDAEDRREHLRSLLRETGQQTREGDVLQWTPELERQLLREADEMDRRGVPINPEVCP
jgi:antitoxin ParD1/3/4